MLKFSACYEFVPGYYLIPLDYRGNRSEWSKASRPSTQRLKLYLKCRPNEEIDCSYNSKNDLKNIIIFILVESIRYQVKALIQMKLLLLAQLYSALEVRQKKIREV